MWVGVERIHMRIQVKHNDVAESLPRQAHHGSFQDLKSFWQCLSHFRLSSFVTRVTFCEFGRMQPSLCFHNGFHYLQASTPSGQYPIAEKKHTRARTWSFLIGSMENNRFLPFPLFMILFTHYMSYSWLTGLLYLPARLYLRL